jgi:hypothetical protein
MRSSLRLRGAQPGGTRYASRSISGSRLISYGRADACRQYGVYTGRILKGAQPESFGFSSPQVEFWSL